MTEPQPLNLIEAGDELDGAIEPNEDFVFVRIGPSLPLKASHSPFDLHSPPSHPLAVSHRHRLLLLAHSQGFLVAKTKDVIELAKEVKEKGEEDGRSVESVSVMDVKVGRVKVLAVSGDEMAVAAAVGGEMFFFFVDSLIGKVEEPAFSCLLVDGGNVKDFRWQKNMRKSFLVLSSHGSLYHGVLKASLKALMDNVDAVDWSRDGDFIAVARNHTITILSSNFKELLSFSLFFQSWLPPESSKCTIKVDSVKWVRDDCIIVGCFQVNEDGDEEGYNIQIITSNEDKLSEASSKTIVYSFSGLFDGVWDVLPRGCGPYFLESLLDFWDVILASNQKAIDNHVLLFNWSVGDKRKEVAMLDFTDDKYRPIIDLQENGEDNLLLGLGVDKFSTSEKVRIQIGTRFEELPSRYVLLCLTSEGKLILYHAARISEPSASPQTCFSLHDDQDATEKHSKPSSLECSPTKSKVNDDEEDATLDRLKQINTKPLNAQKDAFDFQGKTVSSQSTQEGDGSHVRLFAGQTGNLNKLSEAPVIPRSPFGLQSTGKPFGGDIANAQPATFTSNLSFPGRSFGVEVKEGDGSNVALFAGQTGNLNKLSETPVIPRSPFSLQSSGKPFGGDIPNAQPSTSNISIPGRPFGVDMKEGDGSHLGLFAGQTRNLNKSTMVTPQRSPYGSQSSEKSYVGDVPNAQPSTFTSNMSIPGKPFGGDVTNAQSSPFTSNVSVPTTAQEKSNLNKSSSEFMSGSLSFSSNDSNKQSPLSIYYSSQAVPLSKTRIGDPQLMPIVRGSHESAQEGSLPGSLNYSKEQTLFEDIRASKFPLMVSSKPDMWKQYSVEDLVQKLDILLSSIEKEEGFEDACSPSHKSSLMETEDALEALSRTVRQCKKNIEEQLVKVQQLQKKMLLVSTRKDYMKGIVEQASNRVYWDFWDRQKLNSEFDAKWNTILFTNQNLTNHIIELEKHFNTIEISKFCGSGRIQPRRSTFQSDVMPSRQIKSLQSVCNTLNSQLVAAEHLSKCLSKQMSELNISSAPAKGQNTKKDIFESIGFSHEISALQSPYFKRPSLNPDSVVRTPLPSKTAIAGNFSSVAKTFGPDTARRRRDSLDRNRTSFVPPKMTVKRIVQEPSTVTADKPFRKAKEVFDSQFNEFSMQQRSNSSHPSSSLKYHPNKGIGESHREHFAGAQAKDNSTSAQKETTDLLPSLKSPSLSAFSSPQSRTIEVFASPDILNIEHPPVGTKDISSFRTVSNVQFETSSSLQTSLTFSSSMSPMNTRSPVNTDAKSLNLRSKGNLITHSVPKSSLDSRPSIENDDSISSFSTPPDFTSVGLNKSTVSFDKVTSKNQSSGSIFNLASNPKAPVLTPSLPGSFSFSATSVASTTLSTTSQAPISFGKPSPSAKPVGVTNQTAPVSTLTSTTNSQSLPSSSTVSSQSRDSAVPTNTPIKPTLTLGVPSSDVKSLRDSDQVGSVPLPEKSFPATFSSLSTTLPSETRSDPTLPVTSASIVDSVYLNMDSLNDQPPATQSAVSEEVKRTLQSEKNLNATGSGSTALAASNSQPQLPSSAASNSQPRMPSSAALLMSSTTTKKNEELDPSLSQEDEMEEEAVDTSTVLSLGSLGGFGLGSSPASSLSKPNPFGGPLFPTNNSSTTSTQATSFTISPGELFRPPSFNLPSAPNPVQLMLQQPASSGGFQSGFGGGGMSGFGQPSHVGVGQQALGSVLGAFGQSRQPGVLPEVGFPSSTAFGGGGGGFSSASTGKFPAFGGFAGASAGGGGFTSVASPSSGFAAAAKGIGGFAGVSSGGGGGFAGAAGGGFGFVAPNSGFSGASGGGFGSVAPNSGFALAAPGGDGGFGGGRGATTAASGFTSDFGSSQGDAFSAFGQNSASGSGKPPAALLTQMRK